MYGFSCFRPEQYPRERPKETIVLLNNLVLLAEILKNYLQLNEVEVLCRLMECLITAIVLQKKETNVKDESGNEDDLDDLPEEVSSAFKRLSECVAKFVERKLSQPLEYSTDEKWKKELQVIIIYFAHHKTKSTSIRSCLNENCGEKGTKKFVYSFKLPATL